MSIQVEDGCYDAFVYRIKVLIQQDIFDMIVYLLEMIDQEIFKDGSFLVSLEVFFMISEILIHDTFQGEIKHSNMVTINVNKRR